jgi:hypothetical protein
MGRQSPVAVVHHVDVNDGILGKLGVGTTTTSLPCAGQLTTKHGFAEAPASKEQHAERRQKADFCELCRVPQPADDWEADDFDPNVTISPTTLAHLARVVAIPLG